MDDFDFTLLRIHVDSLVYNRTDGARRDWVELVGSYRSEGYRKQRSFHLRTRNEQTLQ